MKKEHTITIDLERCNSCGLCVKDCPRGLWEITGSGAQVTQQDCVYCGHCVAICPQGAVSITGFEEAPEPVDPKNKPDPEQLLAMMKGRRSVRQFTDQEIPPEIVEKIIEAGRYTPTGLNRQGVSYVVLRDNKQEYERLAVSWFRRLLPVLSIFMKQYRNTDIGDQYFFRGAPVVIVVKASGIGTGTVDGAIAASAMELTARAYGLGVLYLGFFPIIASMSPKLKRKLSVVSGGKIVTALVLGYPEVRYQRTAQREKPMVQYD